MTDHPLWPAFAAAFEKETGMEADPDSGVVLTHFKMFQAGWKWALERQSFHYFLVSELKPGRPVDISVN